jgi:hypothetical protein
MPETIHIALSRVSPIDNLASFLRRLTGYPVVKLIKLRKPDRHQEYASTDELSSDSQRREIVRANMTRVLRKHRKHPFVIFIGFTDPKKKMFEDVFDHRLFLPWDPDNLFPMDKKSRKKLRKDRRAYSTSFYGVYTLGGALYYIQTLKRRWDKAHAQ